MKPHYYVYALNYGAPTVRHATLAEAQAEAERLAEKHSGRAFEILKCVGHSSTSKASTFWMGGEGPPHPLGANASGLARDEAEFLTEQGLTNIVHLNIVRLMTPRTDAMRLKMAQLGWPPDGEPVAMMMASHDKLERELADLNDQITILRSDLKRLEGFAKTYRLRADEAEDQLAAERALADRLAAKLQDIEKSADDDELGSADFRKCCRYDIPKALAAWKEARREQ